MIRPTFAALALAAACFSGAALPAAARAAGEISREALDADHKSCLTACADQGASSTACSSYCDCTIQGIGDRMSLEEYRRLSDAAAAKEPAPQPALDKLKAIAGSCRAQMPQ